jgi:hypothetical protein
VTCAAYNLSFIRTAGERLLVVSLPAPLYVHLTFSHVALLPEGEIGLGLTSPEGAPVARLFLRFANAEVSTAFVQHLPLEQLRKVLVMRAMLAVISVREIRHMVYVLAGLDLRSDRGAAVPGTPRDPRRRRSTAGGPLERSSASPSLLQESAQCFLRA